MRLRRLEQQLPWPQTIPSQQLRRWVHQQLAPQAPLLRWAITAVTALDYLGFGLPPPTPSLGELLKQGTDNLTTAPWIVASSFFALVFLLTLVAFVGEAIREAFDPKKFTVYQ